MENLPPPPDIPLFHWLAPTIVVLVPIVLCCILPLCCLLLYRAPPNIRSNRDGAEMTNQRGLNRRNRQSIASERALNQVVVSASSSSNLEASQHSSSSASSSSDTHTNTHTNLEQYGERAQDQVVASQHSSLSASSSSETLTNLDTFVQPTISPRNSNSPSTSTTLQVNVR